MKKTVFENFSKLKLQTDLVGLEKTAGEDYFCVPIGAQIFSALGVDGVQFCFIDGFGEMVFAISPNGLDGKYVNPLAYTFADFLGLVLGCKNANPIEQIYWQSKEQFAVFLQEDMESASEEQNKVLVQIQSELKIAPISNPYDYVRELQTTFDYSQIKYSDEYYDITGLPR